MLDDGPFDTVQQAILAIDRGDTLHGLITLECAPGLRSMPLVNSYLAYCMARERGQVSSAVDLCQTALQAEPDNPAHYLNLGRIFLVASDKPKAIAAFWRGISKSPAAARAGHAGSPSSPSNGHQREHALILEELRRLGIRKRATFPSLHRAHPLNRIAGRVLSTFGLR